MTASKSLIFHGFSALAAVAHADEDHRDKLLILHRIQANGRGSGHHPKRTIPHLMKQTLSAGFWMARHLLPLYGEAGEWKLR